VGESDDGLVIQIIIPNILEMFQNLAHSEVVILVAIWSNRVSRTGKRI
jgi:hypothetical protein